MLDEIRNILTDVLHLGERGKSLNADSALLGTIPELDSMAVVSVLTVIEEHYGIEFDDDDITADSFATLGALCSVVEGKFASQ